MKVFIRKLIVVILIVTCIDLIVGFTGNAVVMHMPESSAFISHTTYSVLRKSTDILVIGASKAKHGIDPLKIRDSTGLGCYNAGEDGQDMIYYDMVLHGFLNRKKPKIVILDMAPLALDNKPGLSKFLYGMSPIVDDFSKRVWSWDERLKLHSNLYRFNGFFPQLTSLFLNKNKNNDGYTPLDGQYTDAKRILYHHLIIDPSEKMFLDDFVETCKKNSIKLMVYVSPTYYHNNYAFNSYLRNYCSLKNIYFKDMSQPDGFRSFRYYNDRDHVNRKGAQIFTDSIIKDIKNYRNDTQRYSYQN